MQCIAVCILQSLRILKPSAAIHRAELRGRFGSMSTLPITLSVVAETYDRLSAPLSFPNLGDAELEQAIKDMNAGPVREGNTGYIILLTAAF